MTPSGVNFFKKSTFIQPKLETSNLPYVKKINNVEKPADLEYFDSLLEDSIVNFKIEALEEIKIIGDSPVNENRCRS